MNDRHKRVRFRDFSLTRSPNGRCEATVLLAWDEGSEHTGRAAGVDSQTGALRCGAEAAIDALCQLAAKPIKLELLGVKSVRAFDTVVVVVSLASHVDDVAQRLVGSCIIQDEPARGAALAVLNATNRLVGNVIHTQ